MSWTCRLIEKPELDAHGNVDLAKRVVGDMWFLGVTPKELLDRHLTAQYFADNAKRQPLMVMLPGPTPFCIDYQCFNDARGYYDGWTVHGEPPLITITPSINLVGRYHGFLQNGVISADAEGRKFP